MRRAIQKLPPHVTSLIAAGEFIKRPEDIVRELIDNSLDAGATQIHLSITQGGLEKIQITDNGNGIVHKEMQLALMHHATSKIRHIDDIETIKTLGFRGEALASIRAVARLTVESRVKESAHGFIMTSQPTEKELLEPKPVAYPNVGTTITITELFHHISSRRRFLRTATTEFARIHNWVKHLSVSHASVAFTLEHNKRCLLKHEPPTVKEDAVLSRISSLYSVDFVKSAIAIEAQHANVTLTGWISSPDFASAQSDWQSFYVNSRLIKDKALSHAVKRAYQDVLYRERLPAVVLFLTLDGREVDVNVHPTKAEVRFHQPQAIYRFVYQTIQSALSPNQYQLPQRTVNVEPIQTVISKPATGHSHRPPEPYQIQSSLEDFTQANFLDNHSKETVSLRKSPSISFNTPAVEKTSTIEKSTCSENSRFTTQSLGYAIAQLHGIYILAQNDTSLIIVDAHAAHERILYENLKNSFAAEKAQKQALLVPTLLTLDSMDIELLNTHHLFFKQMGFDYIIDTENSIKVKAIPHIFTQLPYEVLIKEMLVDLKEHGLSVRLEEKRNKVLATIACRSATHANRTMSLHEMNQLLRLIETTPHSGQCNHGRPTWREITLNELDRWFLRGQ